jgi:hypothetical protein
MNEGDYLVTDLPVRGLRSVILDSKSFTSTGKRMRGVNARRRKQAFFRHFALGGISRASFTF